MNRISWNSLLSTGNPELDVDHGMMVRLFNRLADTMNDHKGKAFCCNGLNKIIQITKVHFDLEQELMARHDYPNIEKHTMEHASLMHQLMNWKAKFEAGSARSYSAMIHIPEEWLTRHILSADRELAEFIASRSGSNEKAGRRRASSPGNNAQSRK